MFLLITIIWPIVMTSPAVTWRTWAERDAVLCLAVAGGRVHVALETRVDALRAGQVRGNVAQVGRSKGCDERTLLMEDIDL